MNLTFTNATARSASDLLADLQACRQLRHVFPHQIKAIVKFFFGDIENALLERQPLPGTGRYFVWLQEAFEEAVSVYGYSCDACDEVVTVPEGKWRYVAERALRNMDGETRLCLCGTCATRFSTFCVRQFGREARALWTRELEQMMLAFIAHELGREARRVMAGREPRRRKDARSAASQDRGNRDIVQSGRDRPGSIALDWNPPEHSRAI